MAGPGGKEVGRVSIRVVPDTEKFRERLEKSLKRETKGLKVEIPVMLKGVKKATAKLDKLARDRRVKVHVDTEGGDLKDTKGKAKISPDVDLTSIQRQLDSRRWTIDVHANVDNVKVINKKQTIKIDPDIDMSTVRGKLKALKRDLKVAVKLDIAEAKAKLNWLTRRRKVDIDVDVDKDSLGKASKEMDNAGDAAKNMGKGFMGLSGNTQMLVAAVTLLLPLIVGLAATLISAIPSLIMFGGALAGIGYLGFDGIKKAAESLGPVIDNLKESVSGIFEKELTPAFERFGTMLTGLTPAIEGVAGSMAKAFSGVMDVISSPKGFAMLEFILGNISTLMDQLAPTIQMGTNAFMLLAATASTSFGRLANVFEVFTTHFNNFVVGLTKSGDLDRAFAGLQAALNGLSDGFFKLMDAGVKAMAQIGPAVGKFFSTFGDFAAAAMPILGSLLTTILNVASALMKALTPALKALQPAFAKLGDFISQFAEKLSGPLGDALASLAGVLADSVLRVLETLEPHLDEFVSILAVFLSNWTTLAENGTLDAITESFGMLAEVVAELIVQFAPLAPHLANLAKLMIEELLPLLPSLINLFKELALLAIPVLIGALKLIIPGAEVLIRVLGIIVEALIFVIDAIAGVLRWFRQMIEGFRRLGGEGASFKDKMIAIWEIIKEKTAEIWDKIKSVISEKMNAIKDRITSQSQEWVDAVKDTVSGWVQAGRDLIEGLIEGIKQRIGDAVATAKSMASQVLDAAKGVFDINSPSKEFRSMGYSINEGLSDGIKEQSDRPIKATKDMATRLKEEAAKNFKDLPQQIGQQWANSFASDLGFSSNGAIGSLIGQLMDPEFLRSEQQNIYVVKDLDEAERHANNEKKKKSLQYVNPGMRRG